MSEDEILKTLEAAAETFHDLTRWHLLGDQRQAPAGESPDPPKDEIWF